MPASDQELIDRARALIPAIKARASQTESLRKLHDDTLRELLDAELVQMFVPKRWGGSEADLRTMLEVVAAISSACVSSGWITAFFISHNVYVAKLSFQAQEELFGSRGYVLLPAANAPTMSARRVPGGWEVTGRASWASGIMHADWMLVTGITPEGLRIFVLPVEDLQVDDVWHFAGMAGTGSNDVIIENAFVPDHRTLSAAEFLGGPTPGNAHHQNPLYTIPLLTLAYCTIVPVITGGVGGALREYENMVAGRVRNFGGAVVKDQQHSHIMLGEMQIATRIADDLARLAFDRTHAILHTRPFQLEDRLALKGHVAWVSKHCRGLINDMMSNAGATSFHLSQPLQRYWRDLNTVCSHAFWDWDTSRELVGRRQLDLPVKHPLV
ncbi:MAG: hypothetical protein IT486_10490 [Gammaproteobacteria bacterium]|nr:hypothetical protein [Gammaproteobacteria bacterium]